ncbi:hypothetical protein Scep_004320 [Stephania cephalantha]|uniref:BHLH domain-containing protein n=1 Tax=Stephania cephalantha TaxID=152367 RepID=A0AAP0KS97_9MAGN
MDANLIRQHHHQQQQQQMSSAGLMRYRSAPSTLLANFADGGDEEEGESMFARFMNCGGDELGEVGEKSPTSTKNSQLIEQNAFCQASPMMYQTPPLQSHLVNHQTSSENAYRVVGSMPIEVKMEAKIGNTGSSHLVRHSSSPAGLFARLNVENGYGLMRSTGTFGNANGSNGEAAASTSRLKSPMGFSSSGPSPSSSSGLMSQLSEIGSESIGTTNGSVNGGNRYLQRLPIGSWDDSALDNVTGFNGTRDLNKKIVSGLNSLESQNGEVGNQTPGLVHHFSLPKTSAEMNAILQFQDSVPCKIRAKRGCATHPRSIAERVRRTRISERMRKLQELVPNMDKQTNTADMLDLAVEYIKDLQKQVKTLSDGQANCTCSSKQKAY